MKDFTAIPNDVLEAMPDIDMPELKLTAVLIRNTIGRLTQEVRMTYDEMQKLTGLSRGGVSAALDAVCKRGFFWRGNKSRWRVESGLWDRLFSDSQTGKSLQESLPHRLNESLPNRPLPIKEEKKKRKITPPPRNEDPELKAAYDILLGHISTFEALTGLKRPSDWQTGDKMFKKKWLTPVQDMKTLANGRTEELIHAAVAEQSKRKLGMATPASIYSVFCELFREGNRPQKSDNQYANTKSNGKGW